MYCSYCIQIYMVVPPRPVFYYTAVGSTSALPRYSVQHRNNKVSQRYLPILCTIVRCKFQGEMLPKNVPLPHPVLKSPLSGDGLDGGPRGRSGRGRPLVGGREGVGPNGAAFRQSKVYDLD